MLQSLIDRYCRLLSLAMVACMAVMVVLVFTNVVLRYAFNSGISLSEELSRWLFVWMTFLGAVVAVNKRGHLGTDSLVSRLSIRGKKVCLGASLMLMLWICWLVFDGGLQQARINWTSTSAVMETSMAWFYLSGVVFSVLAAIILAQRLWLLLSGRLPDSELVGVQESEDLGHLDPPPVRQA